MADGVITFPPPPAVTRKAVLGVTRVGELALFPSPTVAFKRVGPVPTLLGQFSGARLDGKGPGEPAQKRMRAVELRELLTDCSTWEGRPPNLDWAAVELALQTEMQANWLLELTLPPADYDIGWPRQNSAGESSLMVQRRKS